MSIYDEAKEKEKKMDEINKALHQRLVERKESDIRKQLIDAINDGKNICDLLVCPNCGFTRIGHKEGKMFRKTYVYDYTWKPDSESAENISIAESVCQRENIRIIGYIARYIKYVSPLEGPRYRNNRPVDYECVFSNGSYHFSSNHFIYIPTYPDRLEFRIRVALERP